MSMFMPCLSRRPLGDTGVEVRLGHELLDDYLRFVAARCRPNSVLAAGYDLKVFFTIVGKDPVEVTTTDVLDFIAAQRLPAHGGNVVRLGDGEKGLSARTIARRVATLSGLYGYLCARDLITVSPVPTGLSVRLPATRQPSTRATPLIRTPRTLPRVLDAADAARLLAALRTHRDRTMVLAMLLGGLRRCEVLGLRLTDFDLADRRITITEGKGGHHRIVPVASGFFTALSDYLDGERNDTGATTSRVFVTLKGPRRGQPLSAPGLDEILRGARNRAGITQVTCHMLRHTCLTRLREAGMSLEAVQAQAGHRNIASTRIYLHLADTWLSTQYHQAVTALDSLLAGAQTGDHA
ncbi:tyrosine-type recombinase/integrase [[Mycobacterium] zoologicum]|uniref:tyrosine-type recombinase/integrase n=1 Tax=[Mycobacterium] zoologicum TaxID=2872311 RepID=UPI002B5BF2D8|nr:tyrosine-type recombinase/integrase [Mycolicibacter sp. MYC101]MEB3065747.1 tyrosine-type recombinase/integrase [Mycolicibacter sp. MYC101]